MSQDSPSSDASLKPAAANSSDTPPDKVYLVSYPKIMYLYPTVITALFCGIFMWAKGGIPQEEIGAAAVGNKNVLAAIQTPVTMARASLNAQADEPLQIPPTSESSATAAPPESAQKFDPDAGAVSDAPPSGSAASPGGTEGKAASPATEAHAEEHTYHNVCARTFLVIMALNLVVIAFDFPRTTSLTWFFAIAAVVIALWFILTQYRWLAPEVVSVLLKIKPAANASFYLIFAANMIFLYLCVLVSRRFDYWEVKGNELLHHHGFLSNLERFSAPNLRIDKEINDVFEYLLLRSGRLIIHASNERRAIVLENVLFINDKEERITKMLGALQVRVRTDRE